MSHVVTEGNGKSCVNDVKRFRGVRLLMTEFDCPGVPCAVDRMLKYNY